MIQIILPTNDHLEEIRNLNERFLITHLSDKQIQNGFIRIKYSREELKKIIKSEEVVIAIDTDKVVGYYLIGKKSGNPALNYQKKKAQSLINTHSIQFDKIGYGCQVCISEENRNNGISRKMIEKLINQVANKYDYLLGSISANNKTSLQNSQKIGWTVIDENEIPTFYLLKVK